MRFKKPDIVTHFKMSSRWIWFAVSILIFYSFFLSGTSFYKIFKLAKLNHTLKNQVKIEHERNQWLKKERHALKHDLNRIEKEARQQYGMAAKDEIVIKIR